MMHHPNMHHQPMSGHPPQHMGGHQGMPAHHQIPPHQMHRENRVPLGAGGAGGAMNAHGPSMGMGAMGVPPPQRPPHPIRAMPHHPQAQHHSVAPQQMKPLRRPYAVSGGYPAGGVMHPPYPQRPPMQPPLAPQHPPHTVISAPHSSVSINKVSSVPSATEKAGGDTGAVMAPSGAAQVLSAEPAAQGDSEATRPAAAQANSKEKTPMCLVNELARYNKIKHQYRLTSEMGPAHKKIFTVTLRLGDTEEYTAEGSSIKRAQHSAASSALAATHFPPPPPRAPAPHHATHPHHRHTGAVMPTVELNALAMKLCQPAIYSSVPPVAGSVNASGVGARVLRRGSGYRALLPPAYAAPTLLYRVRVAVGARAWLGEGTTPQAARHDAAARALHDLRAPSEQPINTQQHTPDSDAADTSSDLLNSEVKSPVSLVHELALKRNLIVLFSVKSERGPPHMRVFVTTCTVGDMETDGEGNGKKVSKRRAAERMLDEMRRRWPPALLRARPPHDKRRQQPTKKKPRNLIKPEPVEGSTNGSSMSGGADNPISRLAVARHAVRARSPQYRVLEERGAARRREFLVQCDAPPHSATGLGPNKKTAKRRAAHNVLLAMELSSNTAESTAALSTNPDSNSNNGTSDSKNSNNTDSKRKEGETLSSGGANSDVRQPVPGVLMMDYHQRSGQPQQPNGVSESSATGGSGGNTPGAKDQLMYLSQLLGFTVQFSDFPKRNHGEYLSLVSLSTEPPVMCHGGGPSTAHSHEQCSRAALRALALMGLDAPSHSMPSVGSGNTKSNAVTNGVAE